MRIPSAAAMAMTAAAMLACAGDPEVDGPPTPPVAEVPEQPMAVAHVPEAPPAPPPVAQGIGERHPITCCDTRTVSRVVEEYLDLQDALHHETSLQPAAETYALRGVLKAAAKDAGLPAAEREIIGELVDSLDAIKDGDLDQVRGGFPTISRHVVFLALAHQGGRMELAEAWCDEGPWLQRGEELASPWVDKDCGRWR